MHDDCDDDATLDEATDEAADEAADETTAGGDPTDTDEVDTEMDAEAGSEAGGRRAGGRNPGPYTRKCETSVRISRDAKMALHEMADTHGTTKVTVIEHAILRLIECQQRDTLDFPFQPAAG